MYESMKGCYSDQNSKRETSNILDDIPHLPCLFSLNNSETVKVL